jgi:4-aminobutyrate aminotransferase
MGAVEIVHDQGSKMPAPELRDRIVDLCFREGVLFLGCGPNTVRLCPPLVVEPPQVDRAILTLTRVIEKVSGGKRSGGATRSRRSE